MKKKVFITGISSPIIQEYASLINNSQYEIVGLTRNNNLSLNFNARLIVGDLENLSTFKSELETSQFIIHAAAITHSYHLEDYNKINYLATKSLVDVCKKSSGKFIFISSNTAGLTNGAYAKSKWLAEEYIKQELDNYLIFRPSEVYGTKSQEGIEKLIVDALTKSLLPYPAQVPSKLYPIHTKDAIRLMYGASFVDNVQKETIAIIGQKAFSIKEIIQLVEKIKEKKIWAIPIPKLLMFYVDFFIQIIPFKTSIYPDQIRRLYELRKYRNRT